MKVGLKLWSVNVDSYLQEACRLYKEGCFDYIELYIVPGSLSLISKWRDLKIPFVLHAPHSEHGMNLAMKEKEAENRIKYEEVKQFADILKVKHIIFHGGVEGSIQETARQLSALNESRALIENKPFRALPRGGNLTCRGYNYEEIHYVMQESGCGFCLDFCHAVCAAASLHQEPYGYIQRLATLTPDMYHLSDVDDLNSQYDVHRHLGKGSLDVKKLLNKVCCNHGYITIETDKDFRDSLTDFQGDAMWLKNIIHENCNKTTAFTGVLDE